jgi:SAM-dependent methyltransferase
VSYSRVADHTSMVFDSHRNGLYANAIRRSIKPDSVVLDLGAGLGIHGLIAAAAGAKRVYLVEPSPVVHMAKEAALVGGFSSRITVLQDRIEDVDLPEPVDLIVSVFTGKLLFSEDLLPSLFHARDRYLKPGGRLLPDHAELWLAPLMAPLLHAQNIGRWSEDIMGLDFSATRKFAANEILWLRREEFAGSKRLSPGVVIAEVDMQNSSDAHCNGRAQCSVEVSGLCHGLIAWIRIRLVDQWMSTCPGSTAVHWAPVMLPCDPPLPLVQGEDIGLSLIRPAHGDWSWSISARAGVRRHSTFAAQITDGRELRKIGPDNVPGLSDEGARILRILDLLQQGLSNRAIAATISTESSIDLDSAMRQVQFAAWHHGGRSDLDRVAERDKDRFS